MYLPAQIKGMAVAKFFGEERTPDAVYAVYLRKVRYVAPTGYENVPVSTYRTWISSTTIMQ